VAHPASSLSGGGRPLINPFSSSPKDANRVIQDSNNTVSIMYNIRNMAGSNPDLTLS